VKHAVVKDDKSATHLIKTAQKRLESPSNSISMR